MQISGGLCSEILRFQAFSRKESFFRRRLQKTGKTLKNKKILKQKKKGKNKRNERRNCKIVSKSVKIFAANAAGIKCKTKSFDQIISTVNPQIWMIQETKLKPDEKIKCERLMISKYFI